MNNNDFMSGFYTITQWFVRIVYLNLLWFLYTLMGLVIFGIFPSTIAMFTVVRKWMMGEKDISINKLFWRNYKTEFKRSNLMGIIFIAVGSILYLDLSFVMLSDNQFTTYLLVPLIIMAFVYVLTLAFTFPVYVHYAVTIPQIIMNAFFIMVLSPLSVMLILLSIVTIFFLVMAYPVLLPFFNVNVLAWVIMFFANHKFDKIHAKKEQMSHV